MFQIMVQCNVIEGVVTEMHNWNILEKQNAAFLVTLFYSRIYKTETFFNKR